MTAVHLFDPHEGRHCAAARPSLFRRALRLPRRKTAVPVPHPGAGAATPPDGLPVLRDRMISDVRREYGAGLPTIEQMRREYFARPVYGETSVANVLEAERLNRVMRP